VRPGVEDTCKKMTLYGLRCTLRRPTRRLTAAGHVQAVPAPSQATPPIQHLRLWWRLSLSCSCPDSSFFDTHQVCADSHPVFFFFMHAISASVDSFTYIKSPRYRIQLDTFTHGHNFTTTVHTVACILHVGFPTFHVLSTRLPRCPDGNMCCAVRNGRTSVPLTSNLL